MTKKRYDETSVNSILAYAKKLEGHSLREIIGINWDDATHPHRGSFGNLIESEYFDIHPGNSPDPDFPKAGIELKTTGLKEQKGHLLAKERIKLNTLNYREMFEETWENSHYIKKNSKLLLIAHIYNKLLLPIELIIKLVDVWGYSEEDMAIIRNDWENIQKKIKKGLAHEISEGDTLYLGACTSGVDAEGRTTQPKSTIPVKTRALCLKQQYVNFILWKLSKGKIGKAFSTERIIKDPAMLKKLGFEDLLISKFKPYLGMSTKEIAKKLKVKLSSSSKNYNDVISKAILGLRNNPNKTEEFEKADITMRSVAFEKTGTLKESISFPMFKYDDLIQENNWEDSPTREMFDKKFFFVVYQKDNREQRILRGVKFWNIPLSDLDKNVRAVWKETIMRLKKDPKSKLPGSKENPVSHIRPHGNDGKDVYITRSGLKLKKYSFWFNAAYIKEQLKDMLSVTT